MQFYGKATMYITRATSYARVLSFIFEETMGQNNWIVKAWFNKNFNSFTWVFFTKDDVQEQTTVYLKPNRANIIVKIWRKKNS